MLSTVLSVHRKVRLLNSHNIPIIEIYCSYFTDEEPEAGKA